MVGVMARGLHRGRRSPVPRANQPSHKKHSIRLPRRRSRLGGWVGLANHGAPSSLGAIMRGLERGRALNSGIEVGLACAEVKLKISTLGPLASRSVVGCGPTHL